MRKILLPKPLAEKIYGCNGTRIQKEKLVKLCEVMLNKMQENDTDVVELPQNYLKKIFKCKQNEQNLVYKNLALEIGLIQPVAYGINKRGQLIYYSKKSKLAKRFSFVDTDMMTEFSTIENFETEKESDITTLLKTLIINENSLIKKLPEWAEKKANEITIFSDDKKKFFNQISVFGRRYSMTYKKAKSIADKYNFQILKDGEKYVIDNLENYKELKRKRSYDFNFYNIKKLSQGCFSEPTRNFRNQRVDYILTNISKELFTEILIQNNKGEFDLCSSQYTLFGNLLLFIIKLNMNNSFKNVCLPNSRQTFLNDSSRLESSNYVNTPFEDSIKPDSCYNSNSSSSIINSSYSLTYHYSLNSDDNLSPHYVLPFFMNPLLLGILATFSKTLESYFLSNKKTSELAFYEEVKRFIDVCVNDKLYTSVAEDRSAGKLTMMEVFFSSYRNSPIEKKRMKEVFPEIIRFIDFYKKRNGEEYVKNNPTKKRHGCFPVALQQLESILFIDTLLPALRENGLFALPKHDSLIVDADKVDEARKIIADIMDGIGFKADFKISGNITESNTTETVEKEESNFKSANKVPSNEEQLLQEKIEFYRQNPTFVPLKEIALATCFPIEEITAIEHQILLYGFGTIGDFIDSNLPSEMAKGVKYYEEQFVSIARRLLKEGDEEKITYQNTLSDYQKKEWKNFYEWVDFRYQLRFPHDYQTFFRENPHLVDFQSWKMETDETSPKKFERLKQKYIGENTLVDITCNRI